MQKLEGECAGWYNLRKRHSGAFWSDRYYCTLVDGGTYTCNCMKYINLNMVHARVVHHPSEWRWCGYDELIGIRQGYRLLDLDSVVKNPRPKDVALRQPPTGGQCACPQRGRLGVAPTIGY